MTYICNICGDNEKIIIWEKKYFKYGFICISCKKKIDRRLKQILMGF